MHIQLEPGDRLVVRLQGTDGEFQIDYNYQNMGTLVVESDLPDDEGRQGVIYKETFNAQCEKCSSREIRLSFSSERIQPAIEHLKRHFQNRSDAQIITIDGIRAALPYGWGIVRASNTQPVLSLRFEANSAEDLNHVKEDFIEVLADYVDTKTLREELF